MNLSLSNHWFVSQSSFFLFLADARATLHPESAKNVQARHVEYTRENNERNTQSEREKETDRCCFVIETNT